MNIQALLKVLEAHDLNKAAQLLEHLEQSEDKLNIIKQVFDYSHASDNDMSVDVRVLYRQIYALTSYRSAYQVILLRDFYCVLQEMLTSIGSFSSVTLEESEYQDAISLYSQAMQGKQEKQLRLADFYKNIGRDDWAFTWYEFLANKGIPEAIYWIGNYYYEGIVVKENFKKAFNCYRDAALKGHPDATNNYADMYFRGEYVKKDEQRAGQLFLKAANLGVAESMYTLGYMYENGVGTEKDLEKSTYWYTQSANKGDVFAINRLGHKSFEKGHDEAAFSWYKIAADLQDAYGEYNLGLCYETGIGTPINIKKAKYWYQRSALKGDKKAKEKLTELKRGSDPIR